MPNNVMWLMHRPSGAAVAVGRRMAVGWYRKGDAERDGVQELFDYVEQNCDFDGQDDFVLVMNDCSSAPACGGVLSVQKVENAPEGSQLRLLVVDRELLK